MPFTFGEFTLDEKLRQLDGPDGRIEMRRQVFDVLSLLVQSHGRLVTKEHLFDVVWDGKAVTENTLSQCVTAARKIIGDSGRDQTMIETRYGEGFCFVADVERAVPSQRPAVAILPFATADGAQRYFADGIGDDLLQRLTQWRVFPMISQSSSAAVGHLSPREAGLELGARYVIHGRVDRSGERIRVNAHLADVSSGLEIWTDRYQGMLDRVFELQDEICTRVAAAMQPQIFRSASAAASSDRPAVDAWDEMARGIWHVQQLTREDNARARDCFERSLELDPTFLLARERLGMTHYHDLFHQWSVEPAESLRELGDAADECIRTDAHHAAGHVLKGLHQMIVGRRESAIKSMHLALEQNPSLPVTHSLLGQLLAMGGRPEEGRPHLEEAIRLSPHDPRIDLFYTGLAIVEYCDDNFEGAIDWAEHALRLKPDFAINYGCIAACRAHLKQFDDARDAISELLRRNPSFSASRFDLMLSSAETRYRESFKAGLSAAGLDAAQGRVQREDGSDMSLRLTAPSEVSEQDLDGMAVQLLDAISDFRAAARRSQG